MQLSLDPKYHLEPEILAYLNAGEPIPKLSQGEISVAELRELYAQMVQATAYPIPADVTIHDESISSGSNLVRLRCYRPPGNEPKACLIYCHGGGWVLGSPATHDDICAELADEAGATVIGVDYRLAPEHIYPAALDDIWAALQAIAGNPGHYGIDPQRIVIGGDSAGGNLAAAVALRARDEHGPAIAGQLLIYPGLSASLTLPSHHDNRDAPILTAEDMAFYWTSYVGDPNAPVSPYAAPLTADNFANLPAALILTMEYDPLRDDGRCFARELEAAGGEVHLEDYPGLVHGCLRARHQSPGAGRMFASACAWLREYATLTDQGDHRESLRAQA